MNYEFWETSSRQIRFNFIKMAGQLFVFLFVKLSDVLQRCFYLIRHKQHLSQSRMNVQLYSYSSCCGSTSHNGKNRQDFTQTIVTWHMYFSTNVLLDTDNMHIDIWIPIPYCISNIFFLLYYQISHCKPSKTKLNCVSSIHMLRHSSRCKLW